MTRALPFPESNTACQIESAVRALGPSDGHRETSQGSRSLNTVAASDSAGWPATGLANRNLVSIVIPALNEASAIRGTIASIPYAEFHRRGLEVEVLVVDNDSSDGTGDIAARAGARVVREEQRGYGFACRRGFREATGAIICTIDADMTYPADALPALVDKLVFEELDFISTDRFAFMHNGVMSKRNKVGNALLSHAARIVYRLPFRDSQSGMWVFKKSLLDRADLRAGGMSLSEEIKIEAAWRLRARCAEVPIKYGYRTGDSKLRVWRDGAGNLLHLAVHRFR